MPNKTTNYGLTKPLSEEFYDINVQNENMEIIDRELKKRVILGEDGKVPEEQLPDITNIPVTSGVPDDADIWIDPDDEAVEHEHITDKNNPHDVTPAQIGAVPTSRKVNGKPLSSDVTLNAADVGAAKSDLSNASGTFGGAVKANASAVSSLGTAQVRNVIISASDLTAGSSALATGDSYHVYA